MSYTPKESFLRASTFFWYGGDMNKGPTQVTEYQWRRGDMEDFIKDLYGVMWDGQAAMDYPANDTYYRVEVIGTRLSVVDAMHWEENENFTFKHAKQIVKNFKAGMYEDRLDEWPYALPGLEFLLQWLCFQKHIPAGKYSILVSW